MKEFDFTVNEDYEGERIDKYLSEIIPEFTRSFIQKQIDDGALSVNNKKVKSSYRIINGDIIHFICPDAIMPDILPENIPVDIIYEDGDVCIINKPQGMVVHPGAGHYSGTLVNALLYHLDGRLSGINGVLRPGIVHRIDKDTSGLLMICKNDNAHNFIAEQLKDHSCDRIYQAVVHGNFEVTEGTVDAPIGRDPRDRLRMAIVPDGRNAVTHYKVLKQFKCYSLVELKLETGRTHQIRVHMASIGHPLMGDPVYCKLKEPVHCEGQILHAKTIGFTSPSTGKHLTFDSELPEYFVRVLSFLEKQD